jgi:hypothetical protein
MSPSKSRRDKSSASSALSPASPRLRELCPCGVRRLRDFNIKEPHAFMFTPEQKQKRRRADIGLAIFFAVVFFVGSVMFIGIVFLLPHDLPAYSRWLIRIASFILSGAFLILFIFFILQIRFSLTGRRRLTIRFGKPDSRK